MEVSTPAASSYRMFSTNQPTGNEIWITNVTLGSTNHTTDYNMTTAGDSLEIKHTVVGIVFIVLTAFILMISTVAGNLLVIIAYRTNRRLRSVNNLFLVSLACSDLVIGIVSMNLYPIMITYKWPFGDIACDIWLCIDYTLSMASVANLMLICLDRYFSVTRPFTYRTKRTRLKAKIAIIIAWIFSMLLWSPAILIWPRVKKRTVGQYDCYIQFLYEDPVISCVTAILAFYLPVIIMIILYCRIFRETRRCRQYMEYLRSYKVSQGGSKSPFVKRKLSKRNSNPIPASNPTSPKVSQDVTPRRRLNSSPASNFRGGAAGATVWRPDPLLENPHEPPCAKTIPYSRCSDCDEGNGVVQVPGLQSLSPKSNRSSDIISVNNNVEAKESASRPSHFQRLKRTIVDSIRNSFKAAANDHATKEELKPPDANYQRRDTASSCCDQSHTLSISRRSSADPPHSPCDRSESCTALLSHTPNTSTSNNQISTHRAAGPNVRGVVVPIIVTPDESNETRPHRLARRTKSEADGLSSSASLAVPSAPREPAPARPDSAAETAGPGKIPASDRKAARTLSAILLAFVITWLPYNVCAVYATFCSDPNNCVPTAVWNFAYYLCYINSTLNPFCYAACNKTFRNTFVRLLTCSNNRSRTPKMRFCCFGGVKRSRDRYTETATMQPSTSSSRSVPPSPLFKKRESSST